MGGAPRPFLGDRAVTVSWSPDGYRIAYHLQDDGDSMYVADRTGANRAADIRRSANEHNHFPVWSMDGRWIFSQAAHRPPKKWTCGGSRRTGSAGASDEAEQRRRVSHADRHPHGLCTSRTIRMARVHGCGLSTWNARSARRISFGVEKYTSVAATPDGAPARCHSGQSEPRACGQCRSSQRIMWLTNPTSNRFHYPRPIRARRSSRGLTSVLSVVSGRRGRRVAVRARAVH